jgi:hypothetical protein
MIGEVFCKNTIDGFIKKQVCYYLIDDILHGSKKPINLKKD